MQGTRQRIPAFQVHFRHSFEQHPSQLKACTCVIDASGTCNDKQQSSGGMAKATALLQTTGRPWPLLPMALTDRQQNQPSKHHHHGVRHHRWLSASHVHVLHHLTALLRLRHELHPNAA